MVGFSEEQIPVTEAVGATTVCLDMITPSLTPSQRRVEVSLSRQNLESDDFELPMETNLEFSIGQTQICADITINDDDIVEGPESYMLVVITSDPAVDIFRMRSLLTIIDNDSKCALRMQ